MDKQRIQEIEALKRDELMRRAHEIVPELIAMVKRLEKELEPLEGVPATAKWTRTTVDELKKQDLRLQENHIIREDNDRLRAEVKHLQGWIETEWPKEKPEGYTVWCRAQELRAKENGPIRRDLERYRELAKVVRGLQQAKEEYNHWYDSKTPQERVPEAKKECRLRAIMAQKERDVIDAATDLLKEAHDAKEG